MASQPDTLGICPYNALPVEVVSPHCVHQPGPGEISGSSFTYIRLAG